MFPNYSLLGQLLRKLSIFVSLMSGRSLLNIFIILLEAAVAPGHYDSQLNREFMRLETNCFIAIHVDSTRLGRTRRVRGCASPACTIRCRRMNHLAHIVLELFLEIINYTVVFSLKIRFSFSFQIAVLLLFDALQFSKSEHTSAAVFERYC